jgi:hypothetical protein
MAAAHGAVVDHHIGPVIPTEAVAGSLQGLAPGRVAAPVNDEQGVVRSEDLR